MFASVSGVCCCTASADDPGPKALADMAVLLFDDTAPKTLWTTHLLLAADLTYFKQVGRSGQ